MDRLKFRVYDNINKTYDYKFPYNQIGLFYIAQNGHLFSDFGNAVTPADPLDKNKFTVEQCIGFSDKIGNLIYENDLVKDKYGYIYRIVWVDGAFKARHNDPEYADCNPDILLTDKWLGGYQVEIVGNIHEHGA